MEYEDVYGRHYVSQDLRFSSGEGGGRGRGRFLNRVTATFGALVLNQPNDGVSRNLGSSWELKSVAFVEANCGGEDDMNVDSFHTQKAFSEFDLSRM